jgi:hypothetical protein
MESHPRRNSIPSTTVRKVWGFPNDRSIELGHLSRILSVMPEYYTLETGYKKLSQGGYKPEYKLSIPKSQNYNRITRFKRVLKVTPLNLITGN